MVLVVDFIHPQKKKNVAQLIQKVTGIVEPPFHVGAIRAAKMKMIYSACCRFIGGDNFKSISVGFAIPFSAKIAALGGVQCVEFGFGDWG